MLARRCGLPRPALQGRPSAAVVRLAGRRAARGYAKGPNLDFLEEEPWADEARAQKQGSAKKKKPRDPATMLPPQKPKTQRRLEKEAESNLAYRTMELAPGEHVNFNLVAATMLFRKPVIFPELTKWEQAWYTLQEKRRKEEARRANPFKKGVEEPPDLPRNLRPADRLTAADRANERRTTDRRLDQYVFLLVKKDRPLHAWQFPRVVVPDGAPMRQSSQAMMRTLLGDGPLVFYDTNAPCAHNFYRYGGAHRTGKVGALEFFYRAELIKGNPTELKGDGIVDFAWAAPDELAQYLSPALYRTVADAMPPVLGAREDPAFNLVPPPERKVVVPAAKPKAAAAKPATPKPATPPPAQAEAAPAKE